MGFEEGQIILDSPTGAYYSGQHVNGRVVFELSKVKTVRGIFVKIKGFCAVHWTSEKSRRVNDRTEHYTVSHDSNEEYLNLKMYLVGSKNAEHHLKPGKHEYPFSFQIPDSCPSSFEGSYGHVRYELKAVVDRPFKIDQEITHPLRVIAPLDLNYQNCKEPRHFEFDQNYCCWCMSAGSSHTVVKLPVTGFCPGQSIPLEVSCTNTSSVEIDVIKFSIKKDTTYRAIQNPDEKYDHDTVLEVRKGPISGNSERNWTVQLAVPETTVYNLSACSFIDIHYTFKISVETSGCHTDSDDSCPIIFGTIPIVGFLDNVPGLKDQMPQITPFPVANSLNLQPIINQPIAANNLQNSSSPYPGPNPPYPNNSPYPSTNPPYPGGDALPNTSPFPGANPPYPNTSPYPSPNPPYPNTTPVQGNPPYPTTSPYPGANSPYPNSTQGQGNPPYPTTSPYPGANPPYPNSTPVQGNSPYPNSLPNPSPNPPYPNSTPVQGNPPYPNSTPVIGGDPPYPNSTPGQRNPPYPNSTPVQGNPPYPNSTPSIGGDPPYPNSTAVIGDIPPYGINTSPYPTGQNPPYPGASPYPKKPSPMLGGGLRTGTVGFMGVKDPASIPLLPDGAAVPHPLNVTSPYATASAPEPGTPGSEQKKLDDDPNNSPYNPDFVNKN